MDYNGETFDELIAAGNYSTIDLEPHENLTYYGEYMLDDFDRDSSDAVWEDFQDRYTDLVAAGGGGINDAKDAFDAAWTDAQNKRKGHNEKNSATRIDNRGGTSVVNPVELERRDYLPHRKPEYIEPRALPEPPIHSDRRGRRQPQPGRSSILRIVGRLFRRNNQ